MSNLDTCIIPLTYEQRYFNVLYCILQEVEYIQLQDFLEVTSLYFPTTQSKYK